MEFSHVKEILRIIGESPFTEIKLEVDDLRIIAAKPAQAASGAEKLKVLEFDRFAGIEEPMTIIPEKRPEPVNGNVVESPLVGTFYESPSPGLPPFVSVGSKVKKGDVLCIIEAMKVMNEIVSDQDGVVSRILVSNGEMVEYGQPIFIIGKHA
jgi:acetyl-CoA carboxylase biotin carboxyl carrier protein